MALAEPPALLYLAHRPNLYRPMLQVGWAVAVTKSPGALWRLQQCWDVVGCWTSFCLTLLRSSVIFKVR